MYQWVILQKGNLPLKPDGSRNWFVEHACTTTLVWPDNEKPVIENTVIVDPCFTVAGYRSARKKLSSLKISLDRIGHVMVTHKHIDHQIYLPSRANGLFWEPEYLQKDAPFPGLSLVHCPGHHPYLTALRFFDDSDRQIWIVGDAILDIEWLVNWNYYWPNRYTASDVIQTWKSVGNIVSNADIIIPGHGNPIRVNRKLLKNMIAAFPGSPYVEYCPEVKSMLEKRLDQSKR